MAEASSASQRSHSLTETANVSAYVRWRPLIKQEVGHEEIKRTAQPEGSMQRVTYLGQKCKAGTNIPARTVAFRECDYNTPQLARLARRLQKRERKATGFNGLLNGVFEANQDNQAVFEGAVQPCVDHVMSGGTGAVFSYGQTGSGKTHTILGYGEERGLYYQAMEQMEKKLKELNRPDAYVSVSFTEMHNKSIYDLLNNRKEGAARESGSGEVVFRARTEEQGNKSGGFAVKKVQCKTAVEAFEAIQEGLKVRTSGESNVHSESSRSHAFLELELTTARIERYRELATQLGEEFQALVAEEERRQFQPELHAQLPRLQPRCTVVEDGPLCQYFLDRTQERNQEFLTWMTKAQLEKPIWGRNHAGVTYFYQWLLKEVNKRIEAVEAEEGDCFKGKLLFVDLAGSEYGADKRNNKQTNEEWQEARQINISLAALNEVLKAKYQPEKKKMFKRVPYRASLLTLILRKYFNSNHCKTVMIGNLSSSLTHSVKSSKTLRYCCIVAKSGNTST